MRILALSVGILFAVAALPVTAAEYDDVIVVRLHEGCPVAKYVKIKDYFNATWAKDHDYRAQVSVPLQAPDLSIIYWVGRSANATAFGKTWDAWRDALSDPKSTPPKL